MSRAEIRTVTFDVGGTLIRPWPSVGHVYAESAKRLGIRAEPSVLDACFTKSWRNRRIFNHTAVEWEAVVAETFTGLLPTPAEPVLTPLMQYIHENFSQPSSWQIFPDVHPAIDALASRGINLGIISNWDERLLPLLHKLDLAKYFEAIVVSCDVGFQKPSPVIFEQASRKLGEAPQYILHVGDSREHDLEGAAAAGYQSRWLERNGKSSRADQISSLIELAEL